MRFELTTSTLARLRSTPELRPHIRRHTSGGAASYAMPASLQALGETNFRSRGLVGTGYDAYVNAMTMNTENNHTNSPRVGAAELFDKLDALGLDHQTHQHDAVFTVEESRSLRGVLPGAHIKNLFLRDKKKNIWLVTALEDRQIDLKALRRQLGAKGNLSFGNAELLMDVLGVTPGSVTPFGVINDQSGRATVVLDKKILGHDLVNAHPLRNDQTTAIAPGDLLRFLDALAHPPIITDFEIPDDDDA